MLRLHNLQQVIDMVVMQHKIAQYSIATFTDQNAIELCFQEYRFV